MTTIKGTIEINPDQKTITVHLENGSYALDLFAHGMGQFLADEINIQLEGAPLNWGMNGHDWLKEQFHAGRTAT